MLVCTTMDVLTIARRAKGTSDNIRKDGSMLYYANRTFRKLPAGERASRIAVLGPRLREAFLTRNRGRLCDVKAGLVDADTGECTMLRGVTLTDISLVERGTRGTPHLMFEITTQDECGQSYVSHTDNIADVMFRD